MPKLKKTKLPYKRQNNIINTSKKENNLPFKKFKRQNTFIVRSKIDDLINPNSIMYDNDKIKLNNIKDTLQNQKDLTQLQRRKLLEEKERLQKKILKENAEFYKKHNAKKTVAAISALAGVALI